jgi:hypothetical protein
VSRPVVIALSCLALVALASCGESGAASAPVTGGTVGGVGTLPGVLTDSRRSELPDESVPTTLPRSTVTIDSMPPLVAELTEGNRVIVIGDSLMASTARRYGGEMCWALVPRHWAVEVDAETGRFVEFGNEVLDDRLRPEAGVDWDAAVLMLGNNYAGDPESFRAELHQILDRLAPRPTVLFTVTEFRADRAAVNRVVRDMVRFYPNLTVVDWARLTAEDPTLLAPDGLHLSDAGRTRLADETASALGDAATGEGGTCLSTRFTDDSAVGSKGTTVSSNGTRSTTTAPRRTTATTRPGSGTRVSTSPPTTASPAPTTLAPSPSTVPGTTTPATPPPTQVQTTLAPPTIPPVGSAP